MVVYIKINLARAEAKSRHNRLNYSEQLVKYTQCKTQVIKQPHRCLHFITKWLKSLLTYSVERGFCGVFSNSDFYLGKRNRAAI